MQTADPGSRRGSSSTLFPEAQGAGCPQPLPWVWEPPPLHRQQVPRGATTPCLWPLHALPMAPAHPARGTTKPHPAPRHRGAAWRRRQVGRAEPAAGSELQAFASFWNKIITALTEDPSSLSAVRDASWDRPQRQTSGSGPGREEGWAGAQGEAPRSVRARAPGLGAAAPVGSTGTTRHGVGHGPRVQRQRPAWFREGAGRVRTPIVVPRGPPGQAAASTRGRPPSLRTLLGQRAPPLGASAPSGPSVATEDAVWAVDWRAGWRGALGERCPGRTSRTWDPECHLLRRRVAAVTASELRGEQAARRRGRAQGSREEEAEGMPHCGGGVATEAE